MKRLLWIIPLVILLFAGVFVLWALNAAGPEQVALEALLGDEKVSVDSNGWISFTPKGTVPTKGFVFYPGGRVDPRSYAPLAASIAGEGCQVVILKPPLNLAVFDPGGAAQVIEAYPQIENWTVGGHSLGGAMAAQFVANSPGSVEGLILLAAYPASSSDLADLDLPVSSIYGTRDGLTSLEEIEDSRARLPAGTRWVEIEGGNHAQFGRYDAQPGDLAATIDSNTQQALIIQALLEQLGCGEK